MIELWGACDRQNHTPKLRENGKKQILSLTLQKEAVDPDDIEMLQDLIVTCLNQAFKQVDDAQAASIGKYNIPGLM